MLQSLAGWEHFPYVFGVFDAKLIMELITCEDKKSVNSSSMWKKDKLTNVKIGTNWNVFCISLASAVKYMHLKNLMHNDRMSNNVLLKLRNTWIPKIAVVGKVTLISNSKTYKLSNTQIDRYNKIYPHLV